MDAPRRRRWWADFATIVALAGLLLTMLFNTISVQQSVDQAERETEQARRAARQARLSRLDTQVGMLTSVSSFMQQTEVALRQTDAASKRCRPWIPLSSKDQKTIQTELENYDYLAWLFNQPSWTMESAEKFWGPNMLNAFEIAISIYQREGVEREFPELTKFHARMIDRLPRPRPCQ